MNDKGKQILSDGPFSEVLRSTQEAIVVPPFVAIAIRPRPGVWEYVRVDVYELNVEQLTVSEYLHFKEELVDGQMQQVRLLVSCSCPRDLIIGNYSGGNLIASLLPHNMGVTQCNRAHALEKTKCPDSDIYWKGFEGKYHFSFQFTADLMAMNRTDFIITSTYQEIAGTYIQRMQLLSSPL